MFLEHFRLQMKHVMTSVTLMMGSQVDGHSPAMYWREEVGMLHLMVNAKTCLIKQENDLTQLQSPSPGKLVRFLVNSGDHIQDAEIEVCLGVVTLHSFTYALVDHENAHAPCYCRGWCSAVCQAVRGRLVSLEPGDILGFLTLDNPTRVKHAIRWPSSSYGLPRYYWQQDSSMLSPLCWDTGQYLGRLR